MKIHIIVKCLFVLTLVSCSTQETVSVEKIKPNERLYVGNVYVNFNDQKSNTARCDLFLKNSVGAEFKISPSGFVAFAEKTKDVRLASIACIFEGTEKIWVHYPISVKSVEKSSSEKESTYFGDVHIQWVITEDQIKNSEYSSGFGSDKKIEGVGEFKIEIKNNIENIKEKVSQFYPDYAQNLRPAVFEIKKD